ncbi:MAG: DKNYY domain-containing protein [Ignavibacteria bacterium]
MPEGLKSGYYTENNKIVHYSGFPATHFFVDEADVSTFKPISNEYGKDKNHVYYGAKIINQADPATFEYLGGPYSRDKNTGFFQDKILSDDGSNFVVLPNVDNPTAISYAKDSRTVYKGNLIFEGADPASFEFIPMYNGNSLTHDKNNVYFNDLPVPDADGSQFKKVTGFYFKDNENAWALLLGKDIAWVEIPDVDAPGFTGLKEYYAKDKNNVYYENKIVTGADLGTFEELANGKAKDKNGNYSNGAFVKK